MNKDIKIMIELQRYWSKILSLKSEIERGNKNIIFWKNGLKERVKEAQSASALLDEIRSKIKKLELDLEMTDDRLKKLEERRLTLASSKEISAVDKEIEKARGEDETLTETLIELMDEQTEREKNAEETSAAASEAEAQCAKDIEFINSRISGFEEEIKTETEKFDTLFKNLSPVHQNRFKKLLGSKNGVAIAEVEGEVCSGCHFQIPSQLASDSSKESAALNCSNCGRYIYSE